MLVNEIPYIAVDGVTEGNGGACILWLPHLGGSAAKYRNLLEEFASRGHLAVSVDPPLHGERVEASIDPTAYVFEEFRARMWPLLGRYCHDVIRVIGEVLERRPEIEVYLGGSSMGGDVALAVAGLLGFIDRVVTVAATPDWARPGMSLEQGDGFLVVDQGQATKMGESYRRSLEPISNMQRFDRAMRITLLQSDDDMHIRSEPSKGFERMLLDSGAACDVRVVNFSGLSHRAMLRSQEVRQLAVSALLGEV